MNARKLKNIVTMKYLMKNLTVSLKKIKASFIKKFKPKF